MRPASGNLQREVTFTTLGWLQSAAWQVLMTWAWASGRLPVYTAFWASPVYSVAGVVAGDAWRVVSGGSSGAVQVWDGASGAMLSALDRHECWVFSLAVHKMDDGWRVASGSGEVGNLKVRVWEIHGALAGLLPQAVADESIAAV